MFPEFTIRPEREKLMRYLVIHVLGKNKMGILLKKFFHSTPPLCPKKPTLFEEENDMDRRIRNLTYFLVILALVGTVSGAGYVAAEQAGSAVPANHPVASAFHGDNGISRIAGEHGSISGLHMKCYFPIWRLPEYYICIMFCKLGGHGDACPATCEARYTVC